MKIAFSLAVLGVTLFAANAGAQLVQGAPGSVGGIYGGRRPIAPERTSQTFDLTFDFGGGYDRDPATFAQTREDRVDLTRWYAGTASGAAHYRVGSVRRSVEVNGRGYTNYQSNAGDTLTGGELLATGIARFGPRRENQLTVRGQSSYQPGWVFGAFGPPPTPGTAEPGLGVALPVGVLEQSWFVLGGAMSYQQQWNLRHATAIAYDARSLRPMQDAGLDSSQQVASLQQRWMVSRRVTLLGDYRIESNTQQSPPGSSAAPTVRFHTAAAGFRYERRLSSIHRYSLTLLGGMSDVLTPANALDARQPVFEGVFELNRANRLTVSAQYRHAVTVLPGVRVMPVKNDLAQFTIAGAPTRHLRYSLLGSASRADLLGTFAGSTADVVGGAGELRYGFTERVGMFAAYGYYKHRLGDTLLAGAGLPARYDRHSVRIGVTVWLPMYGTF